MVPQWIHTDRQIIKAGVSVRMIEVNGSRFVVREDFGEEV